MRASVITVPALCLMWFMASRTGPAVPAQRADSIRAVLAPLIVTWSATDNPMPRMVADAFVRAMPDRLLLRNEAGCLGKQGFTVEAMRGFGAEASFRSSADSMARDWVCYMGGGGGYCAIIEQRDSVAKVVWSAYPMFSVALPGFEFVELTGDSIPEIVLSGMVGITSNMAGEIISWDGNVGHWLTAGDSAIVGYQLSFEDTGAGKTKRIVVYDTQTMDRTKGPMTRQVVEYDRSRKALVWRKPEVVVPKQK
jgi:hypothetical protein